MCEGIQAFVVDISIGMYVCMYICIYVYHTCNKFMKVSMEHATPLETHQITKIVFLGISWYKFKSKFGFNLNLYRAT